MIIHVKTLYSLCTEGCSAGSLANVSSAERRQKAACRKKIQETKKKNVDRLTRYWYTVNNL